MTRIHSINKVHLRKTICFEEVCDYAKNTTYFQSNNSIIFTTQFHSTYGSIMPGRYFSSGTGYRFGFNGKEMDNEVSGSGNQYDYGFRIYNPRLVKFLSVDPLTKSFPWYTPYQFAGNMPIWAIDLDGLEEYIYYHKQWKNSEGEVQTSFTTVQVNNPYNMGGGKLHYYYQEQNGIDVLVKEQYDNDYTNRFVAWVNHNVVEPTGTLIHKVKEVAVEMDNNVQGDNYSQVEAPFYRIGFGLSATGTARTGVMSNAINIEGEVTANTENSAKLSGRIEHNLTHSSNNYIEFAKNGFFSPNFDAFIYLYIDFAKDGRNNPNAGNSIKSDLIMDDTQPENSIQINYSYLRADINFSTLEFKIGCSPTNKDPIPVNFQFELVTSLTEGSTHECSLEGY